MKEKQKKNKGITLIALVITIIVLLILAGVTIVTLTGDNGLLQKAGEAKNASEQASLEEEVQLAFIESKTDRYFNSNSEIQDKLKSIFEKSYGQGKIDVVKSGKNYKVIVKDTNTRYRVRYNGKVEKYEELDKVTSVYGKLDENNNKVLHLKATQDTGFVELKKDWIFYDVNSSFSGIEKIIIDEDIVPKYNLRFMNSSELIEIENMEKLHTEKNTNFWAMFYQCKKLEIVDLSYLDTSNVTDMHLMFAGCQNFKNIDLTNFDTSNVKNMQGMFNGCGVEELDLSSFNTENVTQMHEMFWSCTNLTTLNVSSFNTSKLENMSKMFQACSNLKKLDLANFNTTACKDMCNMFSGCSSLSLLNVSSFNTSNVENMKNMFSDCKSLVNLDLSGFDTNNVINMSYMFQGSHSFKNLYLGRNFVIKDDCDMGVMFSPYWTFDYTISGLKIKAIQSTADKIRIIIQKHIR